ncbi:MAG: hypothetical protein MUC72_00795 [Acidobacteria bacterium]|jgi:hypothetical protein|nr:hypothetical protein [Acidobacteriota bacterium]
MKKTGRILLAASRHRRGGWVAVLVVLFLGLPAALVAARQGATLRLQLLDGRQLDGELLAVKGEVLLLLGRSGGLQADIRDVDELRIVREGNVGKGIFRGLLAGLLIGGLIGVPLGLSSDSDIGGPLFPVVLMAGLGGGCGAIIGGGLGIIASGDQRLRCHERDNAWRCALLKRLQRLARFRDYDGPAAAGGLSLAGETVVALPGPQPQEFRRWRLEASIVQSPAAYTRAARNFADDLRYGEPVAAGAVTSTQISHDDGQRSWLGMREFCLGYAIDRRWALGIRVNPLSSRWYLYGRKDLVVSGQVLTPHWNMDIESRSYFLAASYSVIAADGFMRDKALRLNAGLGWNRARLNYGEYGSSNGSGALNHYSIRLDTRMLTALSAMVAVEAAHYLNSRWSLALDAGFRYVPLRVRGQELSGFIDRKAPSPDQSFTLAVPGATLNLGGFFLGLKLGFGL